MIQRMAWVAGVVCMALAGAARAEDVTWLTDFQKAREVAAKDNKPIFLLFTGTEWCGVCQILEKNVLTKPEFAQYVKDRLVMVKIEFIKAPIHNKKKAKKPPTPEEQAKIDLALKFDVNVGQKNERGLNGYPSVFLVSPAGENLAQVNTNITAAEAGVTPYIKELSAAVEKVQEKIKQK